LRARTDLRKNLAEAQGHRKKRKFVTECGSGSGPPAIGPVQTEFSERVVQPTARSVLNKMTRGDLSAVKEAIERPMAPERYKAVTTEG
jgi:hypothetical protein